MHSDICFPDAELPLRLQQQELVAHFGRFALAEDDLQPILDEACRVAAEGMATRFAKVLEWQPDEGDLLVRAGVGWRPGTVGAARLGADLASPAGYALRTGEPVVCSDLQAEARFRTPALLAEHGIRRAVNVLVGRGNQAFGVLEVDGTERAEAEPPDIAFLQALANTLAAAIVKERRRSERRRDEAFLRSVIEANPDCVKVLDLEGRLLFMNDNGLCRMELADFGAVEGRYWPSLWPDSETTKACNAVEEARAGRAVRFEGFCPTAAGTPRWWDVVVAPVMDGNGHPARIVSISRDVTDQVRAIAAQEALLREKDLLMQEVHHRVKNSLQLVQSFLGLQARGAAGGSVADQLSESAARVRTIAALHDRLYRSNAGLQVEVKPYLEGLVADLRSSLGFGREGREIRLDADAVTWSAAEVTTLGLVLTELVTNALKYGRGTVRVTFGQPPDGPATLAVEDEGSGLPADFDPAATRGLGMRLVRTLLGGHGDGLKVDRTSGRTRFVAHLSGRGGYQPA